MKILLGVTGSIAAYKALDLTRNLVKSGHKVRVLLTGGAEKFVVPQVFSYLGAEAVYPPLGDFTHAPGAEGLPGSVLHVELARWADQMTVAPLSAHTLANLSQGKACDLLTSTFLAWNPQKPVLLFPAMNPAMGDHPLVKENTAKLASLPWTLLHPPAQGVLVCGDIGEGKLPSVELVQNFIESFSLCPSDNPHRWLITTGATLSPLDPVRYLTNGSSGKTGFFLAKEALRRGHSVCLIAGVNATEELNHFKAHPQYELHRVVTSGQLLEVVKKQLPFFDTYVSSAAINDIEFEVEKNKIKKSSLFLNDGLPIKKSRDVLAWVLENRSPRQKIVGFAAETEMTEKTLQEKWEKKPVDLLIGTEVNHGLSGGELKGFQADKAQYFIKDSLSIERRELSKDQLACEILSRLSSFSGNSVPTNF